MIRTRAPLLLTLAVAGLASTPVLASPWTIDDLVEATTASGYALTPDGSRAVWVQQEIVGEGEDETRVSNLWTAPTAAGEARPLTRGRQTVAAPRISPDGTRVVFLSDREPPGGQPEGGAEGDQLWSIRLDGGEAEPLPRFDQGVLDAAWADADTLIVLAPEGRSAWARERQERDDTTTIVEDAEHEPPVRVFRVELGDGTVTRLTRNDDWIDAVAVSPDGSRAVVTAQQSLSWQYDQRVAPHAFLLDLKSGALTRILEGANLLPYDPKWAPDGSGFFFREEHTSHPTYRTATVTRLWFHPNQGAPVEVTADWPRGLGRGYAPVEDGVVALLADGVVDRAVRYRRSGDRWTHEPLAGTHAERLDDVVASRGGATLLYQTSTATRPPQAWAARLDGTKLARERQLTNLNPSWNDKPTGRAEIVRWTGAEGDEVEGLLHYPLDYREGRRYPLVLDIHGGPTGRDMDAWDASWHDPNILWRQRGAFVLQANYHGSIGYGLEWVESIGGGRYYELEPIDIEAGVDGAIERGLVDPDRLGIVGWSNGGILGAELITRSRRYRAASIGAADVEWISDWANVDFGAAFDNYYFGASPLENPQLYIEKSPFFRLPEVTTPTLVITGTADRNVPPHQSWSLYRALQQTTETPVRLVLFPGEPHGIRKPAHQRRKMEEETRWLDRWLFASETAARPWIPETSPLAALVARAEAARSGEILGQEAGGVPIPETVSFAGLEVGRFEVTRGQWAAFDPSRPAAPGEADLPVTGISFDEARRYAAWAAERSGRAFRLPTEAEARRLAAAAEGNGNTLATWAGYPPNPEDRERILQAVAAAGPGALLRPVGSFPGAGDGAFDLDGNAAEWAEGATGGVPVGPSADRAGDVVDPQEAPRPEYVGLRLVIGEAPAS